MMVRLPLMTTEMTTGESEPGVLSALRKITKGYTSPAPSSNTILESTPAPVRRDANIEHALVLDFNLLPD